MKYKSPIVLLLFDVSPYMIFDMLAGMLTCYIKYRLSVGRKGNWPQYNWTTSDISTNKRGYTERSLTNVHVSLE